ncbi:MAG: 7-carboxy-7-deazaguanine synthase QueE [Flavobacteriales bacterium]|nr:7-carboxy-7-deazaguanine synthase QueE [Flavobacteriales bacterium]
MINDINISSIQEKTELEQGIKLPIMEEFYSIQGEGFNTGKAAYFIRVGGCDVGCHWCDVKESWNPNLHPLTLIEQVVSNVKKHPAQSIVVTGGEPTIYNLNPLTTQLLKEGVELFLETSGAYTITGKWHWICLSPKKTMLPLKENYQLAHELKVIIHNKHDIKWAEEQAQFVNNKCKLYLQPEWSKADEVMPILVDYVMNNPQWNISLQTHKYMKIP